MTYDRKFYIRHREDILKQRHETYLENREEILEYQRNYRMKNKARLNEWARNYWRSHPVQKYLNQKRWRHKTYQTKVKVLYGTQST